MPDSQDGEGEGVAQMVMRVESGGRSRAGGLKCSNWPLSLYPTDTDVSRLWQPYGDCVETASAEQTKHIVSSNYPWPRTAPRCYLARQVEARQSRWFRANERASSIGSWLTKPYRYQPVVFHVKLMSRDIQCQKPRQRSISINSV